MISFADFKVLREQFSPREKVEKELNQLFEESAKRQRKSVIFYPRNDSEVECAEALLQSNGYIFETVNTTENSWCVTINLD